LPPLPLPTNHAGPPLAYGSASRANLLALYASALRATAHTPKEYLTVTGSTLLLEQEQDMADKGKEEGKGKEEENQNNVIQQSDYDLSTIFVLDGGKRFHDFVVQDGYLTFVATYNDKDTFDEVSRPMRVVLDPHPSVVEEQKGKTWTLLSPVPQGVIDVATQYLKWRKAS
jgi:hypothetical protein